MANPQYISFLDSAPGTPLIQILNHRATYWQNRRKNYPTHTQWELRIGYIYLLYFGMGDFYKIGISQNVEQRIETIGVHMPIKPELEHVIKTDDTAVLETSFHEYFRDKRVGGEWFKLDKADIELFKSILDISLYS